MEPKTILGPIHRKFLEAVNQQKYLTKNYYWTGGTVLSEFYLHHRDSKDIDLFTEDKEVYLPPIKTFIEVFGRRNNAEKIGHETFLGLESFKFYFPKQVFKVDFNYYPFPRIDKGKKWKNIEIDSLRDITANKIHTVYMRPRYRDFIDLFFIYKKEKFSLKKIILDAKLKFDWHIDPIQLGQKFLLVLKKKDPPRMLVKFNEKEMENLFLRWAKELDKRIFE